METSINQFIRRAIALAREKSAAGDCGPFGAVVVRHGRIVGEGWNQVVAGNDPTAHAEIVAIRAAGQTLGTHELTDCELYCSCEPCPMCLAATYWAGISTLYYACTTADAEAAGFSDGKIYGELALPWEMRRVRAVQLEQDAGLAVFGAWLANPKRRAY